ncbi:glutamate synthase subunit beta [Candidatus Saganbacteria bacterium]|nr:glutamate synthase subunit beta [Candidatus Saganbacteria bacterium]
MVGDPKGFLKFGRENSSYRPVCERVKDYDLVFKLRSTEKSREQAQRCMDCGVPFCHFGCPLGNIIPEWNEHLFHDHPAKAFTLLDATNILPEITGRVCPAPCEYACVLGINDDPVTVRENELAIVEAAFAAGLIKPQSPKIRTGKKVAVVGSGPAGLATAGNLNRFGHEVTVYEREERIGGIMRYGIPDFKLEKSILDRRIKLWEAAGIKFKTNVNIGQDITLAQLKQDYAALCLAGGAKVPRDLPIAGRDLKGVYFAMEYLTQSNRRVAGEKIPADKVIDAKGKKVVVIGGGDTGSDCVGTANRQGAACVVQIELMPQPPECRASDCPWPKYPLLLKTTSSHEEGSQRQWSVLTKKFIEGQGSRVKGLNCVKVEFKDKKMIEVPGTEFEIEADLVFLAMGFVGAEQVKELGLEVDNRGNVKTDNNYMTSTSGVFSAGDMHRGQSLIVWAIYEGREAAKAMDGFLK